MHTSVFTVHRIPPLAMLKFASSLRSSWISPPRCVARQIRRARRLSTQLRDIWLSKASATDQPYRVDVLAWLSRATLDIIGLAGELVLLT